MISVHSLEDRMVKRFMRAAAKTDAVPRGIPLREVEMQRFGQPLLKVIGKAVRPGEREIAENKRARSAVMRVAERIDFKTTV